MLVQDMAIQTMGDRLSRNTGIMCGLININAPTMNLIVIISNSRRLTLWLFSNYGSTDREICVVVY